MEMIFDNKGVHLILHYIAICTHNKDTLFTTKESQNILEQTINSTCEKNNWKISGIKIFGNHVKLLLQTNYEIRPIDVSRIIKANSSMNLRSLDSFKGRCKIWSNRDYFQSIGYLEEDNALKFIYE